MKDRILSESNIEKIVKRLAILPIQNWDRKDRSYTRLPSGPDSTDFEKRVPVFGYSISLEGFRFEFVFNDNDYYLQVFDEKEEKPLERDFEPSYNPGVIRNFFTKLEERYTAHRKQGEVALLERFNNVINLPRPNQ